MELRFGRKGQAVVLHLRRPDLRTAINLFNGYEEHSYHAAVLIV